MCWNSVQLEKKSYPTNEDIIKPRCSHVYNQNMGGIDNVDRQLTITETVRKTMKWYRKLFFHLIDLCLSNAYALYKMRNAGATAFVFFTYSAHQTTCKNLFKTQLILEMKFDLEIEILKVKCDCGKFFTIFFIFSA